MNVTNHPAGPTYQPQPQQLSLVDKVKALGLYEGKEMATRYGFGYGISWLYGAQDSNRIGLFGALMLPTSQVTSYCFQKALGCTLETPYRNMAAGLANFLISPTLTAYELNSLGYNMDVNEVWDRQIAALKMGAVLCAGMFALTMGLEYFLEDENPTQPAEEAVVKEPETQEQVVELPTENPQFNPLQ